MFTFCYINTVLYVTNTYNNKYMLSKNKSENYFENDNDKNFTLIFFCRIKHNANRVN